MTEIRRLAPPGDIKEKDTIALEAVHDQDRMFREQAQTTYASQDMGEGPNHTQDMGEGPSQTQDMGEMLTQAPSRTGGRHGRRQPTTRKMTWHP